MRPNSAPRSNLSVVGVIGILLLVVADLALLETLSQVLSCIGGSSTPMNSTVTLGCLSGDTFILELLGVLAFGLMAIIGYIGSAVGIDPLGRRNSSTALEVGAVLICLPYLNVVGAILLIAGAQAARARVGAPGSSGYAGLP